MTISIGRRRIVHGLTFLARPGEITAIAGPTGSGKRRSSARCAANCPFPARSASTAGTFAALRPVRPRHDCAPVLPQAATLSFPFTVAEVVRLGLATGRSGVDAGSSAKRSDRVDLAGFADASIRSFPAANNSACSLRVCSARCGNRWWRPRRVTFCWDDPVSSLDIRHQLTIMDVAGISPRAAAVSSPSCLISILWRCMRRGCNLIDKGRLAAAGPVRGSLQGRRAGGRVRLPAAGRQAAAAKHALHPATSRGSRGIVM